MNTGGSHWHLCVIFNNSLSLKNTELKFSLLVQIYCIEKLLSKILSHLSIIDGNCHALYFEGTQDNPWIYQEPFTKVSENETYFRIFIWIEREQKDEMFSLLLQHMYVARKTYSNLERRGILYEEVFQFLNCHTFWLQGVIHCTLNFISERCSGSQAAILVDQLKLHHNCNKTNDTFISRGAYMVGMYPELSSPHIVCWGITAIA